MVVISEKIKMEELPKGSYTELLLPILTKWVIMVLKYRDKDDLLVIPKIAELIFETEKQLRAEADTI